MSRGECEKAAAEAWEKELEHTLILMKKSMNINDYQYIIQSQKNWEKQKEYDFKVISKFIENKQGTMFYLLSEEDRLEIIKSRAKFIMYIYKIINEEI